MRCAVTLILLFAMGNCADAAQRYAIVVGVNSCPDFRYPDGAQPRPLQGAEPDAEALAATLIREYGFAQKNILLLKGKQATYARIETAFQDIIRRAQPEDLFVFHFSGHGTQLADTKPLDEPDKLDEALCCFDTTADGKNLVRDDQLGLWLDDIPARQVTVVLDCCHAGTGTKDPDDEIVPRYLPIAPPAVQGKSADAVSPWREIKAGTKELNRKLVALFACQSDQQAYERRILDLTPQQRRGQFTFYLLEGLSGKKADANSDGMVTSREAVDHAKKRLNKVFNSSREQISEQQSPLLEADSDDTPLFVGTPED